jgi:hypothetical protein
VARVASTAAAPPSLTARVLQENTTIFSSSTAHLTVFNDTSLLPTYNSTSLDPTTITPLPQQENATSPGIFHMKFHPHNGSHTFYPKDASIETKALASCRYLQGRTGTLTLASYAPEFSWDGSHCCYLVSWSTDLLHSLGGCTGVIVAAKKTTVELNQWLQLLPNSVTGLDIRNNGLSGPLPERFAPDNSLEVLLLGDNLFDGTLPESWGQSLPQLKTLGMSKGNSFIGNLPESWGSSTKLGYFRCTQGACNGITGSIPESWRGVKYLLLSEETKLEGELPWKWVYEESQDWTRESIANSPNVLILGKSHGIRQIPDSVCLLRGNTELLQSSWKLYTTSLGEEWFYLISDPSRVLTQGDVEQRLQRLGGYDLTEYGTSPCVSPNRYRYIKMMYLTFAVLLACALVYIVCPNRWFKCVFGKLQMPVSIGPQEASVAAVVTQVTSVLLLVSRAALVLFDMGTDALAAYELRTAPLYLWLYVVVVFTPNAVAALVLHFRLCYVARAYQQDYFLDSNAPQQSPSTFTLYRWLLSYGSQQGMQQRCGPLMLLALSTIPLWLYWSLAQIPMLFIAAVSKASEALISPGGRAGGGGSACAGAGGGINKHCCGVSKISWFNASKHCVLLGLLVACIEAPFSAIVISYHYARGMTAQFPTVLNTKLWFITVGSALLHIALEVFMLATSFKQGRLRSDLKGFFTKMVEVGEKKALESPGCGTTGGTSDVGSESRAVSSLYSPRSVPGVAQSDVVNVLVEELDGTSRSCAVQLCQK